MSANAQQPCAARLPIAILGVPFDNINAAEAVELIERMVSSRRPHYLVTANVDFLVQALEDVELHRILMDAHLVVCDGTPLVWASRLLGNALAERIAGADLVPLLIQIAIHKQYRIFFLGGAPEITSQAVARLRAQYPELQIAGAYSPPYQALLEMDHEEIARRIREAKPDFLFVSFGCPKQEKWMAMHYRALGVPVVAGVGATIDFLAGRLKRAPQWMQRAGLEWLCRLAQEPRRLFGRYSKDLWVFSRKIFQQWWRLQAAKDLRERASPAAASPRHPSPVAPHAEKWEWIRIPERLDLEAVQEEAQALHSLAANGHHYLLDMERVQFVDSTGMGLLIRLQNRVRNNGRQLVLISPTPAVKRALRSMRLEEFFEVALDATAAQELIEAREREQTAAAIRVNGRTSLLWQGEVTAANAEEVWNQTETYLDGPEANNDAVVDLSHLRFIDSTGVGLMVRAKKLARRRGAALKFTGVQPPVRNVLHLSRVESFLLGEAR